MGIGGGRAAKPRAGWRRWQVALLGSTALVGITLASPATADQTWIGATSFSTYRDAVAFGVLILILLVRPAGIMGTAGTEKV